MKRLIAAGAVLALAFPASATADATLTWPKGTINTTTGQPTFRWGVPADETSDDIIVSTRAAINTTDGLNRLVYMTYNATVEPTDGEFTPAFRITAGTWYWQIVDKIPDPANPGDTLFHASAPASFTIPVRLRGGALGAPRYDGINDFAIPVSFTTNTHTARVRWRIYSASHTYRSSGRVVTIPAPWNLRRVFIHWRIMFPPVDVPLTMRVSTCAGTKCVVGTRSFRFGSIWALG